MDCLHNLCPPKVYILNRFSVQIKGKSQFCTGLLIKYMKIIKCNMHETILIFNTMVIFLCMHFIFLSQARKPVSCTQILNKNKTKSCLLVAALTTGHTGPPHTRRRSVKSPDSLAPGRSLLHSEITHGCISERIQTQLYSSDSEGTDTTVR